MQPSIYGGFSIKSGKHQQITAAGIPAGQKEKIFVLFEFVNNGQDQNQFQGDKLKVDWTFNAEQGQGTY